MQATYPTPTANARTLLRDGMRALHAGDKARARALLAEATALEPHSEQGWLWLSGAVETDAERIGCLQRVLALNPQHAAALHGLRMLGVQPVGAVPEATPAAIPSLLPAPRWDPAFDRDRFMLRQKLAVRETYAIWDEYDQPLLYVERPRYLLYNLLIVGAGLGVSVVLAGLGLAATSMLPRGPIVVTLAVIYLVASFVLGVALTITLSKKRHITFYRDETRREPLLSALQDQKFFLINATYTILTPEGQLLATLRKNHLYNLFRKRWYCYAPDGGLLCIAKEDSALRSFLRRAFGQLGLLGAIFLPLLRTNFVILRADGQPLGVFNRKLTLLDRYVLDLSADSPRLLDRRIALALGVLLDTGERR